MNPLVSSWIFLKISKCSIRSWIFSTCPYIMVAELGIPTLWADFTISIHFETFTFEGQIKSLDLFVKISAAVPGKVSNPALFKTFNESSTSISDFKEAS